jgi:hypothetical protein
MNRKNKTDQSLKDVDITYTGTRHTKPVPGTKCIVQCTLHEIGAFFRSSILFPIRYKIQWCNAKLYPSLQVPVRVGFHGKFTNSLNRQRSVLSTVMIQYQIQYLFCLMLLCYLISPYACLQGFPGRLECCPGRSWLRLVGLSQILFCRSGYSSRQSIRPARSYTHPVPPAIQRFVYTML